MIRETLYTTYGIMEDTKRRLGKRRIMDNANVNNSKFSQKCSDMEPIGHNVFVFT